MLLAIERENLTGYLWMQEPDSIANCLAIFARRGSWVIVVTDERAVRQSETEYDDESRALYRFLSRLRSANRLRAKGSIA